jgi:hypothetical protein
VEVARRSRAYLNRRAGHLARGPEATDACGGRTRGRARVGIGRRRGVTRGPRASVTADGDDAHVGCNGPEANAGMRAKGGLLG